MTAPEPLLTAQETARMLRVSERTLRRWTRAGYVPQPLRFGRTIRYRRADVEKWLNQNDKGPPP